MLNQQYNSPTAVAEIKKWYSWQYEIDSSLITTILANLIKVSSSFIYFQVTRKEEVVVVMLANVLLSSL
jgi:hypothetical protein